MTKLQVLALFCVGAAAGAVAPRVLSVGSSTRPAIVLDWQNAQLVNTRTRRPDGGVQVGYRACAYLNEVSRDGGVRRLDEPCWDGFFTGADVTSIVAKMLAAYDGGR